MKPSLRLQAVALAALMAGCAHTPAIQPETYRSSDGFAGAKWGMTLAELGQRLDGAEQLDPATFRTREAIDGRPAQVTWAFAKGHLAEVTVAYQPPVGQPADFDATFNTLTHRYGKPLPPPGSHSDADTALTVAAIVAVVLVIGIIIVIATHSGGGGHVGNVGHVGGAGVHAAGAIVASVPPVDVIRPLHAACWVDFQALQLVDPALRVAVAAGGTAPPPPPPPGGWMAEWRSPETDVLLMGVNLGRPDASLAVAYRSMALNPPPG